MKIVFNKDTTLCLDGTNSVLLTKGIEYEIPEQIAKNVLSGIYGFNIGYVPVEKKYKEKKVETEKAEEKVILQKAIDTAPKNKAIKNSPNNKKNRKK